jgi:hypothetical protein
MYRIIAGVGAGVLIDRAAKLVSTEPEGAQHSKSLLRTGNQRLEAVAATLQPPASESIAQAAVQAQFHKRVEAAAKAETIVRDPLAAGRRFVDGVYTLKQDVDVLRGISRVASGRADLTANDAAAIGAAAARDSAKSTFGMAKAAVAGSFAAATTNQQGVARVAEAAAARIDHDVRQSGAGWAISNTAAGLIGQIPHPFAKVASVGIKVTGNVAFGADMSGKLKTLGGSAPDAPATTQALAAVLRGKAARGA